MSGSRPIADYLDYPWRRRGLDHDRFPHRNLPQAKPVEWPGKARIALWIAVHVGHFPMDMPRTPFVAPGGVDRPYPSYWDYTQRDYGNRVGIYRLMRALDRRGLRATALMSSAVATRYPALAAEVAASRLGGRGRRRRHGQAPPWRPRRRRRARPRPQAVGDLGGAFPRRSAAGIRRPIPNRCAPSISWRRQGSTRSPTGSTTTCPMPVTTRHGPLTAMPLAWDLSDQRLLFQQHMDTAEFVEQVLRAFKTLYAEAGRTGGGRILTLTHHSRG